MIKHSQCILYIIISIFCFTSYASTETPLPRLIGIDNPLVTYIIQKLSEPLSADDLERSAAHFEPTDFSNRLLLYGPPGNGKTTLARDIALASGCEFVTLSGSSIVGRYVGQGAENIRGLFNDAYTIIEISKRPVVIFIDEIDAIAAHLKTEYTKEHKNALQELWINIDTFKHDPRIFFICATNTRDDLERAFIDRFLGNVIEIKNPDALMREKIVRHYSQKFTVNIEDALIKKIAKDRYSGSMSIRSLEDFIRSVSITQKINKTAMSEQEFLERLKEIRTIGLSNTSDKKEDPSRARDIYDKIHLFHTILSIALSFKSISASLQ